MTKKIRTASALSIAEVAMKGAAFVVVASLLAACGSEQQPAPAPVEDTAFGAMAGAMNEARAIEGTLQEHKQALDRTLERNENPTAE